jgi:hypothetical protein
MTDRSAASLIAWSRRRRASQDLPRTSPFIIHLTAAEERELEARTRRYTSPYRDVIRANIVLLAATGLGNDEIGARLDTPRPKYPISRPNRHATASGRTVVVVEQPA